LEKNLILIDLIESSQYIAKCVIISLPHSIILLDGEEVFAFKNAVLRQVSAMNGVANTI